jgi:hypothetical protein
MMLCDYVKGFRGGMNRTCVNFRDYVNLRTQKEVIHGAEICGFAMKKKEEL